MIILGRPRLTLDLDRAGEPATIRVDLRRVGDKRLVPDLEVVGARDVRGDLVLGPSGFVIFLVGLTFLAKRTPFGRHVYAVGGNAEAARRAGINVARIRIIVFVISGAMAGVGGVILAARLNSVDLNVGGGTLLLDAISAAVIGGTSLFGGRGEVRSALIGALVISTVSNGLNTAGYKTGTIYIVTGVILLLAVTLDTIARRLQARSGR